MLRLVSLHFLVRRENVARWAFWRRRRARVFAWLRTDSVDEGRELAEAEMKHRGWRIVRIENARREPDETHPDVFVRQYQRIASRWGSCYTFSGASEEDLREADSRPLGTIRSRYAESDGVIVDANRVPEELRAVLEVARRWGIGDDLERQAFLESVSAEERQAFVDLVEPRLETIEAYCSSLRQEIPVPDEVVLLDMMTEAFSEAQARGE